MGEYHHAIDDKNRLIIPSPLRQQERPKVTAIGNLLIRDFDFTRGVIVRIPSKDEVISYVPDNGVDVGSDWMKDGQCKLNLPCDLTERIMAI